MSAFELLRYVNNIDQRRFFASLPNDQISSQTSTTDPIPGVPDLHISVTEEGSSSMEKNRILVVEDDSDIANLLHIYFTGQGYEVILAARGCDALSEIKDELPNLIVLDILLPDVDGYSLCAELRTAQIHQIKVRVFHPRPAQIGVPQIGLANLLRWTERKIVVVVGIETGAGAFAGDGAIHEPRARRTEMKRTVAQVGVAQIRAFPAHICQSRIAKIRAAKIRAGHDRSGQLRVSQIRRRKIRTG